jgi:hypothetical protein
LNYGLRGRFGGWRDASAGAIGSTVISAKLRLTGNDQQQRQTDEKQQREQKNSVQFAFPTLHKIITHGRVELQSAQLEVIEDIVDCSLESSDDAAVTIRARALCQEAMKRLSLYGSAVPAILSLLSLAKRPTSNLNGLSEKCLVNFA